MAEKEDTQKTIVDQVVADILKGKRESLKAKVKTQIEKKLEAQRTIALCDAEIAKLVSEFEQGIA